jgi:rhodanese-related sulfurtransferase
MDYEIRVDEVKQKLDSSEPLVLVDVRELWEYDVSRIPGARHMPMSEVPTRAPQELDPGAHIVVFCHHGVRSMHVVNWMRQQGFSNAQSMQGGIDAWSRTVDPSIPLY